MSPTEGLSPILTNLGVGGVIIWILVNWLREHKTDLAENARKHGEELKEIRETLKTNGENVEHVIRGLSKAMWLDLAERPTSSPFVKEEAARMLRRAEEVERQRGSL